MNRGIYSHKSITAFLRVLRETFVFFVILKIVKSSMDHKEHDGFTKDTKKIQLQN